MFAKAVQDHSTVPGFKGVSLSQGLRGNLNALKPSTSVLNAPRQNWPTTTNPLKRTASQADGRGNSLSSHDSVLNKSSTMNLSQRTDGGGRVGKLHETVFFDENDFENDADVNLDAEEPMSRQTSSSNLLGYPTLPTGNPSSSDISYPTLPLPSAKLAAPKPPSSSQPLPWSSSPLEHKQTLAKQLHHSPEKPAVRRKIPWLDEQRKQGAHDSSGKPESNKQSYTPLPKDKPNSSYPWNKTASAVKEEQKKLRQGHKKLVKDNEAERSSTVASTSKKKSVSPVYLSDEQQHVLSLVAEQKKSVFFTGSAGTGKSVLLREIIKVLRGNYKRETDRVAVTASTGLAACNVGGVTLHSFGGIGLGKEAVPELVKKIKRNQKAKARWMRTKVLIVDEISMVDGDLFDKLEAIARIVRNNGRPFGGIQLIITGDFFQLPPVPDYGKISKFSFDAATWNTSIEHTIGLTQVFRQKDPTFANMLNEMRLGKLTPKSIEAFRALNRQLGSTDDFEATELFPTRNEVDNANNNRMRNLSGRAWDFKAEDGGSISDLAQRDKLLSNCMAPPSITLKKGAQVMLIKNIDDTLVNGSVGKVIAFMDEKTFDIYHDDEEEFQAVETMDPNDEETARSRKKLKQMINKDLVGDTGQKWPLVRFAIADGTSRDLLCQRESWKIELPNGEIQASRSQVPLILAWALSIHKAQGQTLERVKVDLGKIFEKGQAYVALSRATCQEGLQVLRFDPKKVMAHDKVRNFYDSLYNFDQAMPVIASGAKSKKTMAVKDYEEGYLQDGNMSDDDIEALREMYG